LVRAAVLIGVSQTGNLQTLKAVHDGVRAMERWALGQGMDRELVRVLSDEDGPVEVGAVKKAVKEIVDLTTVHQLIVYFSGHGVNISRGEYWLLSGAPEDSNAAVNVAGSIELARTCGIRHVVLISDACRTAAEGIQGQGIRGSEIFPNVLDAVEERPVDVFFACGLGDPALEVKNPKKAAAGYRAVYTDSLVQALLGKKNVVVQHPEKPQTVQLIEVDRSGSEPRGLVRPVPLSFHLRADVLKRLTKAKVKPGVHQTPVARIISQETWLAEVPLPPAAFDGFGEEADPAAFTEPAVQTMFEVSGRMLAGTLAQNRIAALEPASAELAGPLGRIFEPFGPRHFETSCGFKVRGANFASALGAGVSSNVPDPERQILSVQRVPEGTANLLIEFQDGTGVVLPAIRDYVGSITVEDGAVVNVTYEPVENSARWQAMKGRSDELRSLRALLASSARLGVFRLRDTDAGLLAERMKVGKGLDPSIALYAAYAYHDRQEPEPIRAMQKAILGDLGVRLFDLALLGGELRGGKVASEKKLHPFVPLLSQGWALLRARRVVMPPGLEALGDHRVESLWTLFDPQGVELIRSAIKTKEID
jgi:hypothetical protein